MRFGYTALYALGIGVAALLGSAPPALEYVFRSEQTTYIIETRSAQPTTMPVLLQPSALEEKACELQ